MAEGARSEPMFDNFRDLGFNGVSKSLYYYLLIGSKHYIGAIHLCATLVVNLITFAQLERDSLWRHRREESLVSLFSGPSPWFEVKKCLNGCGHFLLLPKGDTWTRGAHGFSPLKAIRSDGVAE